MEDAGTGQIPIQQHHKSPGGLSAFSGTTARISLPTQELTEVSLEDMLDTLPYLLDASENLLSFVIPAELSEISLDNAVARLQNLDAREKRKLERLGKTFEMQRGDIYGGDSYINVAETLRRLLRRKVGPINEKTARWRPDALFQKANLAILVLRLLSFVEQDQKDQLLEDVASTFPRPFAQRLVLPENSTPECSALAEATFQMALEVRTQEVIMLLTRHVGKLNFDLSTALLQVFYDGNVHIKGWAVPGLRTADLRQEAKDRIQGRVEQLREAFNVPVSFDSQSSGVESLRVHFPWTTFAQRLVAWAGQRRTEIEIQTTTYGGAQAICQGLMDVIQSERLGQSLDRDDVANESDGSEVRIEYDTPSESHATWEQQGQSRRPARADELTLAQFRSVEAFQSWKSENSFVLTSSNSAESNKHKFAASRLKQRQADRKATKATEQISLPQNQGTASDVQVASTAGPSVQILTPQQYINEQASASSALANDSNGQVWLADQDDNWPPEENEEEEEDPDLAMTERENAQRQLAYREQKEAENNKENEIPESQRITTAKNRSIYAPDPLAIRVSPIHGSDSDNESRESEIGSDDDFQTQEVSSNAVTQRGLKPATKRPAAKPATIQRRSPKKARREDTLAHTSDENSDVARDQQETEAPRSQAYDTYVRANESAKLNMALGTKPPQKRNAWTGAETDMLHHLITEYGTSWALLKQHDEQVPGGRDDETVLGARDQGALKDKARNMKMDYLKYVYRFSAFFSVG